MRPFWDTDIKVVARRVTQGSIVRVHRGLYAVKEYWERLDPLEQVRHIMRSLGRWHEQWVFCGASAAIMHGLECSYRQSRPIHVAVGKSRRAKNQATIRYHALTDSDAVVIDGVKVTSIQRTLVDCAAMMPFRYALSPIDAALRQERISKERLLAYVDSPPMLRDRERVRAVLAMGDGRSENGGESECRAVLQEMGFPVHRLQVEFPCRAHPGRVHRVDFLWVREDGTLVAAELDGVCKFMDPSRTSGRAVKQVVDAERERQECLRRSGVDMVRMYYSDLDNPRALTRRLEEARVRSKCTDSGLISYISTVKSRISSEPNVMCRMVSSRRPRSMPNTGDAVREADHEAFGVDTQRHVHTRRQRVDQPLRVSDGAAARTMEVAGLRLDLHRQVNAGDQRLVEGHGCGKRVMQRHACGEETRVGLEVGGNGEVGDIGEEP